MRLIDPDEVSDVLADLGDRVLRDPRISEVKSADIFRRLIAITSEIRAQIRDAQDAERAIKRGARLVR